MSWDLRNKPMIEDKFHDKFVVTENDLCEDCGDCVHVENPQTKEKWRFYYKIDDKGNKIVDGHGVIQL